MQSKTIAGALAAGALMVGSIAGQAKADTLDGTFYETGLSQIIAVMDESEHDRCVAEASDPVELIDAAVQAIVVRRQWDLLNEGIWSAWGSYAKDRLHAVDQVRWIVVTSLLPRYAVEAAKAGDIEGAIETASRIPFLNSQENAVLGIVATPTVIGRVDWNSEVEKFEIGDSLRHDLLASIAVKQVETGDPNGALVTAFGIAHSDEHLDAVPALARVAVALVERGDLGQARQVVEEAYGLCETGWCAKDTGKSGLDSAYRDDIEWAFARITWAQAEKGDTKGARNTVERAFELVGDRGDWLDKARYQIGLAHARAGEVQATAEAVEAVKREDWRRKLWQEVEDIFNGA